MIIRGARIDDAIPFIDFSLGMRPTPCCSRPALDFRPARSPLPPINSIHHVGNHQLASPKLPDARLSRRSFVNTNSGFGASNQSSYH